MPHLRMTRPSPTSALLAPSSNPPGTNWEQSKEISDITLCQPADTYVPIFRKVTANLRSRLPSATKVISEN